MQQWRISIIFTTILFVVSLCTGCIKPASSISAVSSQQTGVLSGTKWKLAILGDQPTSPEGDITLEFVSNRIQGYSGCNNYSGAYQLAGNTIRINDTEMTTMACAEEKRMAQESAYMAALGQVSSYQMNMQRLEFKGANGVAILTFTR